MIRVTIGRDSDDKSDNRVVVCDSRYIMITNDIIKEIN